MDIVGVNEKGMKMINAIDESDKGILKKNSKLVKVESLKNIYGSIDAKKTLLMKCYVENYLKLIDPESGVTNDALKIYI
jgi:hypothetical protein